MAISIFGITFYLYGLILGIAVWAGYSLASRKALKSGVAEDCILKASIAALIFGLLGARVWHLLTDFNLYQDNLLAILMVWRGGLSIFGAIAAGLVGIFLAGKIFASCKKFTFLQLADLAVFGLPLAQIIGRLANLVNGELYGLPTNLPWKIYVAPENRLQGFEADAYYHPLFAYEMVLMSIFLIWVWKHDRREEGRNTGSGFYLLSYLFYYAIVRIILDFLRIDKSLVPGLGLGVNQLLLILVLAAVSGAGVYLKILKKSIAVFAAVFIVAVVLVLAFSQTGQLKTPEFQIPITDYVNKGYSVLLIGEHELQVEVVQTPEKMALGLSGREKIGSEGMLFVFGNKIMPQFWMKDMKFALDLVWIAENEVVEIHENVLPPEQGTPLNRLPKYSPSQKADMVLEIPAGKARDLGIVAGSRAFLVK